MRARSPHAIAKCSHHHANKYGCTNVASRPRKLVCRSENDTKGDHILIEQIRQARKSAGWSQRTLADRIGVQPQVIKRLEKGIGSVPTLTAAMAALDFRLSGVGAGKTISDQLRNRRCGRALSRIQMAERTGLSRTTIANVESGGGTVASLLQLMAVLAPDARRRAPERSYWGEGDKEDRDSRFTPQEFMADIYEAFGEVDLDPCGHRLSPVIAHRRFLLGDGDDGLTDEWFGRLAFVNPPFSAQLKWLRRAHEQWCAGNVETVVCLVPVRTDSSWFHETLSADADIYLLRGRIRFLGLDGRRQHTPFSLMVVALGANDAQRACFTQRAPGCWLRRTNALG